MKITNKKKSSDPHSKANNIQNFMQKLHSDQNWEKTSKQETPKHYSEVKV